MTTHIFPPRHEHLTINDILDAHLCNSQDTKKYCMDWEIKEYDGMNVKIIRTIYADGTISYHVKEE